MKRIKYLRIAVLLLLIGLAAGTFVLIWSHPNLRHAMHHPHEMHDLVHDHLARHPILSPAAFILMYVLLTLSMLPIWWLSVLGGIAFGLFPGIIFTQLGATLAATLTVLLAHWLAGDWIHKKLEAKRDRLRHLDEVMGNNGLLIVMAVRLTHLVPFALSNYFFGLTRITVVDAMLGTFVGGIPTASIYVTIGANKHLLETPRYWIILVTVNILLLVPLMIRWWRQHKKAKRRSS